MYNLNKQYKHFGFGAIKDLSDFFVNIAEPIDLQVSMTYSMFGYQFWFWMNQPSVCLSSDEKHSCSVITYLLEQREASKPKCLLEQWPNQVPDNFTQTAVNNYYALAQNHTGEWQIITIHSCNLSL